MFIIAQCVLINIVHKIVVSTQCGLRITAVVHSDWLMHTGNSHTMHSMHTAKIIRVVCNSFALLLTSLGISTLMFYVFFNTFNI